MKCLIKTITSFHYTCFCHILQNEPFPSQAIALPNTCLKPDPSNGPDSITSIANVVQIGRHVFSQAIALIQNAKPMEQNFLYIYIYIYIWILRKVKAESHQCLSLVQSLRMHVCFDPKCLVRGLILQQPLSPIHTCVFRCGFQHTNST